MIFRRQQVAAITAHARWDFTAATVNSVSPGFALMFSTGCRWRGGATGKAFGLAISRSRVQILLEATLRNNLRQVV